MRAVKQITFLPTAAAWLLAVLLLVGANLAMAGTGGCPSGLDTGKPGPLAGLWEVHTYREITGTKAYLRSGDYILIEPTAVPGEVCIEFTSFVEGNYYYHVAIDESGSTIDDSIETAIGRNLRILVQRVGDGVSIVLYSSDLAQMEGGHEGNAGGAAGGGRP